MAPFPESKLLFGPLGTAALVLLLVICMLFQREDLRSRLIRLIGQGRISATARAMEAAASCVSRYLFLLDITPRQLTEREKRLLQEYANEVMKEVAKRSVPAIPNLLQTVPAA